MLSLFLTVRTTCSLQYQGDFVVSDRDHESFLQIILRFMQVELFEVNSMPSYVVPQRILFHH